MGHKNEDHSGMIVVVWALIALFLLMFSSRLMPILIKLVG